MIISPNLHTAGVTGSIPVPPTRFFTINQPVAAGSSASSASFYVNVKPERETASTSSTSTAVRTVVGAKCA